MELELQGDQELFVETTRRFLETESPLTKVRALYDDAAGFDRDFWRRGAELGWTTMLVPERHGGGSVSGDGLLDLVLVAEEMGRLVAPGPLLPVNVVAETVARSGTPEQQVAELASLVDGDPHRDLGLRRARRCVGRLRRRARRARAHGDDWVLSGTKSYVQDAGSRRHVARDRAHR